MTSENNTLLSQRGASLVIALMFLMVLTVLGLVAVRSSTVQERMAGNDRDRAIAFEAAEAALRDAERDVRVNLSPADPYDTTCTDGLCLPSTVATSNWNSIAWSGGTSRIYGTRTGAGAYPLAVSNPPRYIVELMEDVECAPGSSCSKRPGSSTGAATPYRITARGWGRRPGTQVELQSVFIKE